MSEADLRHVFLTRMRAFGLAHRIESPMESGVPDVVCLLKQQFLKADGTLPVYSNEGKVSWVELKHAHEWPKRPGTKFRFPKFTMEQLSWLKEWHRSGGRCCVVGQVATTYFLVGGIKNLEHLYDGINRSNLGMIAQVINEKVFPTRRVLKWLTE